MGRMTDYARCPLCNRPILKAKMVEGPDGQKVGPGCLKKALQLWREENPLE